MTELSADFEAQVKKAIDILGSYPDSLDDASAIKLLLDSGIDNESVIDIIQFLPIAFIRNWIPGFKWHDTYMEAGANEEPIERKYLDSKSFQIIWQITTNYFRNAPSRDTIFRIGGRSAEFNIINPLLLSGTKLENIKLSKTFLSR